MAAKIRNLMIKKHEKWMRRGPIDRFGQGQDIETWELGNSEGKTLRSYSVYVDTGKQVDLFSFKSAGFKDFTASVKNIRCIRQKLFNGRKARVLNCPICDTLTNDIDYRVTIYGAQYRQCSICGHVFVVNRPSKGAIKNFYAHNVSYHLTYVDKSVSRNRVEQIAVPKAKWIIEQFKKQYGRAPRSILDIGAGAGHFVYACRNLGLKAEGVELNDSARAFASDNFGVDLISCDITRDWKNFCGYDIVTFWGVIEHVTEPNALLKSARQILGDKNALVVCEVPHWNCMSTVIQTAFPNVVVRHLDPLGHINCFTETSLISAYEQSGFAPVAAWYYGMDNYEMVTQLLYKLKDDRVISLLAATMNQFQYIYDRGRLSDTLVFCGRPV